MKIAVIGSGISGLSSAFLLSQKHDVTLFEAAPRLGGHAHTSSIQFDQKQFNVDTGFLVYNELTYPHLTALFKYLEVETVDSDMSLSIQVIKDRIEWAGDSLKTVFAQKINLLRPSFYILLLDILKFHKEAERNRDLARDHKWTVGEMLSAKKYSKYLQEWYILPMIAAIWSTPEKKMLSFPAETFLTFFLNHKLLQVNDRPIWKTVNKGSINYVEKIAKRLKTVRLNEAVMAVEKNDKILKLQTNLDTYDFDHVVFATSAPFAAKILKSGTEAQYQVLNSFTTQRNRAVLHSDAAFMPTEKVCWASWNTRTRLHGAVDLTYYLNRLQPLPTKKNLLLTLNPQDHISSALFEVDYEHPVFDQKAIEAQSKIKSIQGLNGVFFAGAWTRYGFHEDGLLSAVKVAEIFGIQPQWKEFL